MATQPLQYAPWTSDVELGFYSSLANIKINHDKLDSSARKVLGLYAINHRDSPERSTRMQIHSNALTSDDNPAGFYRAEGTIRNFNTIEEFRQVDKTAHVERAGRMIWDAINDGTIYSCPSLLSSFSAISFADLKKYKFTYHFSYPCVHSDPSWRLVTPEDDLAEGAMKKLGAKETETLVEAVQTWRYSVDARQHGFFLAKRIRKSIIEAQWRTGTGEIEEDEEDGNINPAVQQRRKSRSQSLSQLGFLWVIAPLASYELGFFDNAEPEDRLVGFADPSTYPSNPGWMLRNLLVLIRQRWKLDDVQILAYRDTHARRDVPTSLIFSLRSAEPVYKKEVSLPGMSSSSALRPEDVDAAGELIEQKPPPSAEALIAEAQVSIPKTPAPLPKVTGWERNEQNRLVSRMVDLAAYMDPAKLADQAVDLNLRLIKWRISPSIDLEAIKHTSCLLLGAGTLGSYVARTLMGWGVRKISFVDNARVSYSNPVRQPLYNFKDCENGGARKAERAAQALSEIYPGVNATGHVMSVPMAGHPVTDENRVRAEFDKLKDLIDQHDAIFLLMDTRESRWLPTVMGKAAGKIVINAALGFDTFVVMRHGLSLMENAPPRVRMLGESATRLIEQKELGCYFCSDVVAPADSLKSATLDQQCTVTRPGAAPLASALAVELLVSIVQHRLKAHAPAPDPQLGKSANQIQPAPPTDASLPDSHPLGTVPHQLRGYMSTWQTIQIRGQAYDCCAACSPKIVEAYRSDGWEFVKKAINEKGYVEEVSGLAEVQRRAEELDKEIDDWDDDDGDGAGDDDIDGEAELL